MSPFDSTFHNSLFTSVQESREFIESNYRIKLEGLELT